MVEIKTEFNINDMVTISRTGTAARSHLSNKIWKEITKEVGVVTKIEINIHPDKHEQIMYIVTFPSLKWGTLFGESDLLNDNP